jgi:hypothetical protein
MSSSDPTATESAAGPASEGSMNKRPELKDDSLEIELDEIGGDAGPVTVDMAAQAGDGDADGKPSEQSAAPAEEPAAAAEETAVSSGEVSAADAKIEAETAAPVADAASDGRTETSPLVDGPPPTPPRDPRPEDFSDAVATALAAGRDLSEPSEPSLAERSEASETESAETESAAVSTTQDSDIVDADAMVESVEAVEVTPGPGALAAVLPNEAAETKDAPPPSDEDLLHNIVLPPGVKGAPTPGPTIQIGDADRTIISEMPPVPEPDVAPYPPLSWATQPVRKTEIIPRQTLQARRSVPIGERIRSIAGRQVQTSVAQLALLVVAASVMGAAAIKAVDRESFEPVASTPKLVPAMKTNTRIDVATAPRPPEIAPLPSHVDEVKPVAPSEPVTIEPAPRRVARKPKPAPAPAVTAEANTTKPAPEPAAKPVAAAKPAPAAKKPAPVAAPASKPRSRRVAQHTDWVDPFGQ